jgi:hypothetical protein
MIFERGNIGYFMAFMVIGGILGSALGTLIAKIFPSLSVIKANLTGPLGFTLDIISFSIRLNLSAIFGIIAGIIIFKRV